MRVNKHVLQKECIKKISRNFTIIMVFFMIANTVENYASEKSINTNNSPTTYKNLINNPVFPFDTSVIILCRLSRGNDSCSITISRYSKVIYFKCPPGIAYCPEIDYCDFLLPKEPKDSTAHLILDSIGEYCQQSITFHYNNIQYLLKIDSLNLFMKVVNIADTIFQHRFDTTSFLLNTAVIPVRENMGPQTVMENLIDSKTQYFDIMGRILPANIVRRNHGPFANKIIITNQKKIYFQ